VILAVIGALVALQLLDPWSADRTSAPPAVARLPASSDGVRLGVSTLSLARNSARPWRTSDLAEVSDFERRAGRRADGGRWCVDWERGAFDPRQADAVRRRGSVPEVSWEPWDSSVPTRREQPRYRLARIIDGTYDPLIRRFAMAVRRYGGPLRLRFAQEMNGRSYPWAERRNGNRPGDYRRAWRHVVSLVRRVGARKVTWIWAPVVGELRPAQYPGDDVVDVVGVSGFNGGTAAFARRWRPFASSFGPTLDAAHALAPGKPLSLPEIAGAEAGGDKARWIRDMFAEVRRRPYIREVTWFDVDKEADWRISSSARAQAAFAAAVRVPAG
jgi:beta-mannanase